MNGWIFFQFDRPRFVREVVIYNWVKFPQRLFPFEIRVIDEHGRINKCQGKSFDLGNPGVNIQTNPIRIQCFDLRGNSMRLVGISDYYQYLSLFVSEIEIIGY